MSEAAAKFMPPPPPRRPSVGAVTHPAGPPPPAPVAYEEPAWGGVPAAGAPPYALETLKAGASLGAAPLLSAEAGRGYCVLGRAPACDVVMEHPSASRVHAVVQLSAATGEAFVYDCGSTHGTFLNRARLAAKEYVKVNVGDHIRIGASSRTLVLVGPDELLPEEGLSAAEMRELAALEALEKQAEERAFRELQVERAREASAAAAGVAWGQGAGDDEIEREAELREKLAVVSWRDHEEGLSEKQRKLVDKLRRAENTITNLKAEMEKIRAKEASGGGLSEGQETQIRRNERRIQELTDSIELMEEELNDRVADTLAGREGGAERAKGSKKRARQPHPDDAEWDDVDDDDFYDRTAQRQKKKGRAGAGGPSVVVETPATLYAKRDAAKEAVADASTRLRAAEEAAGAAPQQPEGEDELDAYMANVSSVAGQEHVASAKAILDAAQAELERVEGMLKMVDPEGRFEPKARSKTLADAAADAALRAKKADDTPAARREPEPEPEPEPEAKPTEDGFMPPAALRAAVKRSGGTSVAEALAREAAALAGKAQPTVGGLEVRRPARVLGPDRPSAPDDVSEEQLLKAAEEKALADVQRLMYGGGAAPEEEADDDGAPDVFVPPAGQTGDGRSALHDDARFAGRY